MKFGQAHTLEASLRNEKIQSLKAAGYGINVLPSSSVIVTIDSKKVRLQTVEFSEFYTFRYEESDAFYVQDGYYINIQRTATTMGNANPNHTKLMDQANIPLESFSISTK